jgi:hypothetical protein
MLASSRFMLGFDLRYKLVTKVTLPSILQQGKIEVGTILIKKNLMQNLALS